MPEQHIFFIFLCPALNMISSFLTILYVLLQGIVDSVYIIPNFQYHFFFYMMHTLQMLCSYEYICHSDCETAYSARQIKGDK